MADYKAGGLTLSIEAIANDAIKSLDAVIERLSLINKGLGGIKGSSYIRKSAKTPKSNGGVFGFAKLGVNIYMVRRLGRFMANLVQAGSDYNETLNLWQVAMRNNLDVADQFVNKMQKAYGISTKTLMNAQAIFKNMIGSLGQISDQTAYALSEALVQMSADFASLYNVTIESAFQKMQAMLAGQVRPIRSAGLDMTETTLFMFYQQLGGTKTMRQLNRTEKQLLSILAVYQQMGSAGALGDMSKTLNQFANQSRMMTEYWAELKTWSGLLLKDLIDDWGLLVKINALLITATEVVKAIAKSRGLGEENFLTGMFETAEATNDEVDELQGKLLDFDKFRSLEGAGTGDVSIDQKLLDAIAGYSSKIDQAENEAEKLAQTWGKILGFTVNSNGEWEISQGKLDGISNKFETIGIMVGIIVGYRLAPWFAKVITGAKGAASAMTLLNFAIVGGAVYAILQSIDAFKRGEVAAGLFASTIATTLLGAFVMLNKEAILKTIKYLTTLSITITKKLIHNFTSAATSLMKFAKSLTATQIAIGAVVAGVVLLTLGITNFIANFDKLSTKAKVWIPIVWGLVGALAALATGLYILKGNWLAAIGIGAAIAGVGMMISTAASIPKYAEGASDIDGGTLFVAGEMGKTEAVYTGSNGKTNVANVRQMEQAFYNALSRHSREGNGTIVVQTYLDGEKVYENTTAKAKARGNVWSKV